MVDTDVVLKRISDLLSLDDLGQLHMGVLSLSTFLYGPDSPQTEAVKALSPLVTDVIFSRGFQ